MEWQPIATAPIPVFDEATWFTCCFRCLIYRPNYVDVGTYSYTNKGKGRWMGSSGYVTNPTHWIPLPDAPNA